MSHVIVAHGGLLHPFEGMSTFGADWWYVIGPLAFIGLLAAGLAAAGTDPGRVRDRWLRRAASGAARVTGMPDWAAVMVLGLLGFLPILVLGFFWDVAWHVDIGRDEYLLSPPHVLLALGVGPGFGGVGLAGILVATRTRADVAWRWRSLHVPTPAAFLVLATAVASAGWVVDELWHAVYGLDITMWSPTHMGMIGSAFLLGAAAWLLLAESRQASQLTPLGKVIVVILAGAVLEAFSSVQLEYDLGVTQWQILFQPLLIALAAGLALPAARQLLGRGGALLAVGVFLALRLGLAVVVDQVWHFTSPRFPLYLAAAVAVEVAFLLTRDTWARVVAAGTGIATAGLAGEWAWSHVDAGYLGMTHAWQPSMLPSLLWALPIAVAAAAIGLSLGRLGAGRPVQVTVPQVGVALAVLAVGLAWAAPRAQPPGEVVVTTATAGPGLVDVVVATAEPGAHTGAERFEVFAWQGGTDPVQTGGAGHVNIPLALQPDGTWAATGPAPVGGSWKTMVLLNDGSAFGAFPVYLPEDEEYGLAEVPVAAERTGRFRAAQEVLMREAHGDASPLVAIIAYIVLAVGLAGETAILVAGGAALDRRRARGVHDPEPLPLPRRRTPAAVEAQEPVGIG